MLKKLIAFQKLFLNSTPPHNPLQSPFRTVALSMAGMFAVVFSLLHIFAGNTLTTETIFPILLAMVGVWMVNRNLNGSHRLFELVPVSRSFTVANIYLASLVIAAIGFIALWLFGLAFIGLIAGVLYILQPQSFGQGPPDIEPEIVINTLTGNLFMLLVLIIILFVGTTITFLRKRKYRISAFTAFYLLGYALLASLKCILPVSPNTGKVEFLESFSIMPGVNQVLTGVGIATLVIIPLSIYLGYKLYMSPLRKLN